MLTLIHNAIQRLLHERGGLDPQEIDVRFERPTRQWAESLTRPTVNVYLFDLVENTAHRSALPNINRGERQAEMRLPPRRIDLRYIVSAFSSAAEDEQALTWRSLATLLRHAVLPPELLAPEITALNLPLPVQLTHAESGPTPLELWSALDMPPRPALLFSVTAPLDLAVEFSAPLVLTRSLRLTQRNITPASTDVAVSES
jgi:hypothetical protein